MCSNAQRKTKTFNDVCAQIQAPRPHYHRCFEKQIVSAAFAPPVHTNSYFNENFYLFVSKLSLSKIFLANLFKQAIWSFSEIHLNSVY